MSFHTIQRSLVLLAIMALGCISAQAHEDPNLPDPSYWRLEQIQSQFDLWEAEYPEIFHQMTLGKSGQGTDIPMARISDHARQLEAEPRVYFQGALHANEANGTTVIMESIASLLDGYGKNSAVTARVDGLEIYYVPILNIDGHAYVFSGANSWAHWRKTMRDNDGNHEISYTKDGVDLNRNWDWNWDTYGEIDPGSLKFKGPEPFSESENVAVRDFVQDTRPVILVDYHSPVTINWHNCIFWPWIDPVTEVGGPDAGVALDIAERWGAHTMDEKGEPYKPVAGYTTLPKVQNWVYGRLGILGYTMEISEQFWWTGDTVGSIGQRVATGGEWLLDRVLKGPGIKGIVTNAVTGQPLEAEIVIAEMHEKGIGPRLAGRRFGLFQRLTLPGNYTVTATCLGFKPQEKTVAVKDQWQNLDFALEKNGTQNKD